MKYQLKALLNTEFVTSSNLITITSPVDLKPLGSVPSLSEKDIKKAYDQAQIAFEKLQKTSSPVHRIACLEKFNQILLERIDELAMIECLEVSKALKDCRIEIKRSIEYNEETIKIYKQLLNEKLHYGPKEHGINHKEAIFEYVPLGVVLLMSPFNYPINLALAKIAPALLAGNAVIFKPSSQGSLCGCKLAEYLFEAGFNHGEFSCITGSGRIISDPLITNKHVKMISFTGSTNVGKEISQKSKMAYVVLELGGKDPAIVLNDADLEKTAHQIVKGAFSYSGQRCTAIKRVLVDNKIADHLVGLIVNQVQKLTVGSPLEDCDITPMISEKDAHFAINLAKDAINKGAKALLPLKQEKNLVYPTVIDDVTPNMELAYIEQFAPILPIIRLNNINEAIKITNDSDLALQACIFTNDLDRATDMAKQLEVGSVNINAAPARGPDIMPFLGVKDSGLGVQGIKHALISMMRLKGIVYNK